MATPADTAMAFARAQLGKPYVWGATGPNSYDCSGLVQAAYKSAGIALPRTTYQMLTVGNPISRAQLEPGDLVFPDAGHVQIYVGNGEVIEAPHSGTNVRLVPMWGFMAARRVAVPGASLFDTVTGPVKSVVSNGSNVLTQGVQSAVESLPGVKQVETFGTVLEKLSDVTLWKRIGVASAGAAMIIAGILIMARKPINAGVATAVKAAAVVE